MDVYSNRCPPDPVLDEWTDGCIYARAPGEFPSRRDVLGTFTFPQLRKFNLENSFKTELPFLASECTKKMQLIHIPLRHEMKRHFVHTYHQYHQRQFALYLFRS